MSEPEPPHKRRRRRPALSCEHCRRRKTKCDRLQPCGPCVQAKYNDCIYSSRPGEGTSTDTLQNGHFPLAPQIFRNNNEINNGLASDPNPRYPYNTPPYVTPQPSYSVEQGKTCGAQSKSVSGTFSKTRLFGQSHWMHSFGRFTSIVDISENPILNKETFKDEWSKTEILALIKRCKAMSKSTKLELHNEWLRTPDLDVLVPSRELCDTLINLYFSTGESLYRVLHYPSFKRDYLKYWEDPAAANPAFILQMLLVMANGAVFYQEADAAYMEAQAKKWTFAGQHWLSQLPGEKSRLHMAGLQVHCLVIMARQAHGIVGDLAWVSAGNLLRAAINMGMQRDPRYFPKMTPLHAEIRRRLWATIMELNVQLALDVGMDPMYSADDYDTLPPSNIDDADVMDDTVTAVVPKPNHVFTQTTVQRLLFDSLPLRLRACRLINNFRAEPSYETVLEVGAQLIKACKDATIHNQTNNALGSTGQMTQMQRNLLDASIRRFLFLLHSPSCIRALKDPRFHFSRKVCLDSATIMSTYPTNEAGTTIMSLESPHYDQYTLLKIRGQDYFKRYLMQGGMIILHDLFQQIEDDLDSPATIKEQGRRAREPYKRIILDTIQLTGKRVPFAENNVKAHVFLSAVYGQLEAMEAGTSPAQGAVDGAMKSARACLNMLDAKSPSYGGSSYRTEEETCAGEMLLPADQSVFAGFATEEWVGGLDAPESWLFGGWGEH